VRESRKGASGSSLGKREGCGGEQDRNAYPLNSILRRGGALGKKKTQSQDDAATKGDHYLNNRESRRRRKRKVPFFSSKEGVVELQKKISRPRAGGETDFGRQERPSSVNRDNRRRWKKL